MIVNARGCMYDCMYVCMYVRALVLMETLDKDGSGRIEYCEFAVSA